MQRLLAILLLLTPLHAAEPVTVADIAAAEKLIGLQFSEAERTMMLRGVTNRLGAYELIRRQSIPNELPPSHEFNPLPFGFQIPVEKKRPQWKPSKQITRPKNDEALAFMSVAELAGLIRARKISSEELTQFFLARLKKYGPKLYCVVTLTEERALAEARRADSELKAGRWRGPLHGIPYVAKDLLDTKDIVTTWGVSLHTNRVPKEDAAVIRKLTDAGAVLVAKTSLGELAMGDRWFGGLTRNPHELDKGSSGSSAGTASAVAAGLVPFGIGSETMGSIVSPATICGITGLRPTFGRVSRSGAMTLSWSMDKIGPMARSAEDCALVLDAIRGADPKDASTHNAAFNFTAKKPLKKLRIAYAKSDFARAEGNQTNDLATLETFRAAGVEFKEFTWPALPRDPLWLILSAESAAAFDELTRSNQDDQLVQQEPGSWPNYFRAARFIPAVEYIQATRLRTRLLEQMAAIFKDVDVIIAPSWRGPQMLFSNMAGYPCVVVPNAAKSGSNPASICFLANLYAEADAIQAANAYQQLTSFHQQRPKLDHASPGGTP